MRRLWQALGRIPGLVLTQEGWRQALCEDFQILGTLLQPTQMKAIEYPCTVAHGCGRPHRVVDHGDGDIVAVCDDESADCERLELRPTDIVCYRLNIRKLATEICHPLGIEPTTSYEIPNRRPEVLGTVAAPDEMTVYWMFPLSPDQLLRSAASLVQKEWIGNLK